MGSIKARAIGFIRDVCAVPSGGLVVATSNGLYHLKDDGESVNEQRAFRYVALIAGA